MPLNLSGNIISEFSAANAQQKFSDVGPYRMYQIHLQPSEHYAIEDLTAYSVFVLDGSFVVGDQPLGKYDAINTINRPIVLQAVESGRMIVAGVAENIDAPAQMNFISADQQYRVQKPWGHELWISGAENPYYSLKEVFIRQGNRTSLQYHNFKHETNVIFDGTARLHYQGNSSVALDDMTAEDVSTYDVTALTAINITPRVLHRLEAMTDVIVYETSTPHLDDVVRLSDDSGRRNGRIEAEHQPHKLEQAKSPEATAA